MNPFPQGRHGIVYADPPWKYRDKRLGRGGAENHYSTLSVKEIMALGEQVKEVSADDCALFMWGTWPLLPEMGKVMAAWGFEYKTCAFIWVKTNKWSETDQGMMFMDESFELDDESFVGCGNYTRSNSECCLLGTRGKVSVLDRSVKQVIFSPILRQSEKPHEARLRIVRLLGDLPRIELFARRAVRGWDHWGNEVAA